MRNHITRRATTILEILVVLSVVLVLAGLTAGGVTAFRKAAKHSACRTQLVVLTLAVEHEVATTGRYPKRLADVQTNVYRTGDEYVDPWGTPYRYLVPPPPTVGDKRTPTPAEYRQLQLHIILGMWGVRGYTEKWKWLGRVQIISAGPDKKFGPGGEWTPGAGPWAPAGVGADDIGNFNFGYPLGARETKR